MPSSKVEAAWAVVEALGREPRAAAIRPLFTADPDRPARMTHRAGDVLLDLSRTALGPAGLVRARNGWLARLRHAPAPAVHGVASLVPQPIGV